MRDFALPVQRNRRRRGLRKWIIEPDARVDPKGIRTPDLLAASLSRAHGNHEPTGSRLPPAPSYETSSAVSRRCLEHAAPVLGEAEVTDVRPHGERAMRKLLDHALEAQIDARTCARCQAVGQSSRSPPARIAMATGERYHRKRYRWPLSKRLPHAQQVVGRQLIILEEPKIAGCLAPGSHRTTKDPRGPPAHSLFSSAYRIVASAGSEPPINRRCATSSSRWGGRRRT